MRFSCGGGFLKLLGNKGNDPLPLRAEGFHVLLASRTEEAEAEIRARVLLRAHSQQRVQSVSILFDSIQVHLPGDFLFPVGFHTHAAKLERGQSERMAGPNIDAGREENAGHFIQNAGHFPKREASGFSPW